jgi:zinc transport system ATP-binding protein
MIVINDLSFSYGDNKILENINLTINENDFISIIGHNGSGKTTFIKLIIGLLKPSSGNIFINRGKNGSNLIGYINQGSINTKLPITVDEVINIGKLNKNNSTQMEEFLKILGIEELKNRLYKNLSGGQKQKVNIARCLMQESKVILLDEPNSFLDSKSQIEIMEILKKINKENNITIVMISHNLDFVKKYSNKIFLLENKNLFRVNNFDN